MVRQYTIDPTEQQGTGVIIIVMQRLHQDDLVGHVMAQENWEVLSFPAIAQEDELHIVIARWVGGDSCAKLVMFSSQIVNLDKRLRASVRRLANITLPASTSRNRCPSEVPY